MNYEESLEFIESTYKFGEKIGLENITLLLKELGDPHKKLKYVHVAGTNGKGSTCTMLSKVLLESGYKVGLYTSPYLERFNERIQVNNVPIPDDDLAKVTTEVAETIDRVFTKGMQYPSEFEVITAIAFKYYADIKCDIVVLEVGMGGRCDATNVIETNEAAVICSLSFDHQQYLGDTIEQIAFEKCGIIKENDDVSFYALNPESTRQVALDKAATNGSRIHFCDPDDIEMVSTGIDGQVLRYKRADSVLGLTEFNLALLGKHQMYNCLNVLTALEILKKKGWNITPQSIMKGLDTVKFTGRFEILHKNPVIVIDGGHNIEGITSFTTNVKLYFGDQKVNLFYGMLRDKQVDESLDLLTSIAKKIYTLTPQEEARAVPAPEMAKHIREKYGIEATPLESFSEIDKYIDFSAKDEIYAFTGSLYMIGAARTELTELINSNK